MRAQSVYRNPRFGLGLVVVLCAILVPTLLLYGATGWFRLGSETATLRDSARKAMPGACETTAALNIGPATMRLARFGLGLVNDVPQEARQAISACRGVEAGVYHVNRWMTPADKARIVAHAEQAMKRRGWVKIVCVMKGDDMVQVFAPENLQENNLRFAALVMHEQHLIVAAVRGNARPLVELVSQKLQLQKEFQRVAMR